MRYSKKTIAKAAVALLETQPVSVVVNALAHYMYQHRMGRDVETIVYQIASELYAAKKHLLVHITSAHEIRPAMRKRLEIFLKKKFDAKKVSVSYQIDPLLVGGIKIVTPIGVLNLSVAYQFDQLKQYVS